MSHGADPRPGPTVTRPSPGAPHARRPHDARAYGVDLRSLAAVRAAALLHGRQYGLSDGPLHDLVLIANELATNVVRHGGGVGRMWFWRRNGCAYCQVSDGGPGMQDPASAGEKPTDSNALTGRGLWLIRQMSDHVDIDTSNDGTTVTVTVPIDSVASRVD